MYKQWLQRMALLMDENQDGTAERPKATEILSQYNGNAVSMADKLADVLKDNYSLRRKRDELQGQVETLSAKQLPDGATVLSAADAARWADYQALGKPDELSTKLQTAEAAIQERDTLKRSNTIRAVAEAAGYKAPVLERLGAELEYRVKDVTETVNGKAQTVKRPFVVTDGTETPIDDYAAREWPDFLPALKQQGAAEPPAPARGTPGGPTGTGQGSPAPAVSQADAQAAQAPLYRRF